MLTNRRNQRRPLLKGATNLSVFPEKILSLRANSRHDTNQAATFWSTRKGGFSMFTKSALRLSLAAFTLLVISTLAIPFATAGLSAARLKNVPAELYAHHAKKTLKSNGYLSESGPVLYEKGEFSKAAWHRAPELSAADLQATFELARDEKFFTDSDSRKRRATWLYPDDGCFVRAQIAAEIFTKATGKVPAKIFAFDNLNVKTNNSPDGEVSWWYHVAALAKVVDPITKSETFYVYDPAIDMKKPMEVRAWLKAMNSPNAEISVCTGDAYDPDSDCAVGTGSPLGRATNEAQWFLPSEWYRLEELGRDPKRELGDFPPWL